MPLPFASPRKLRALGVVGLNRRNGDFIAPCNPRRFYPRVDNKLITKQLAIEAGIAVPQLFGVVETNHDARNLAQLLSGHQDFVIKPAHGSGGEGIVVVDGRSGPLFRKTSGVLVGLEGLEHHVSNILSGMYSLGGQPDHAMIEYRVRFDPLFGAITYQGVPDIRTVVYKGFPVMAMVRLPTRESDGKANLHQGAVGAGIDIASGHTRKGVWHSRIVEAHPDTGAPIGGREIPQWDRLLHLAARCYELTGLGYLGVDVVLDAELGPLILELNARPGLGIQIANGIGLGGFLEAVDREGPKGAAADARVAFSKQRFGRPD
jgi:alpha-L-glutamate ligase-like protein